MNKEREAKRKKTGGGKERRLSEKKKTRIERKHGKYVLRKKQDKRNKAEGWKVTQTCKEMKKKELMQ